MSSLDLLIDGFLVGQKRGLGVFARESVKTVARFAEGRRWKVATPERIPFLPEDRQVIVRWPREQVSWEQIVVPILGIRYKPRSIYCPGNTFPLLSALGGTRIKVAVHDLIFLRSQGGRLKQRIGNSYRKQCSRFLKIPHISICTVSARSQEDIRSSLGKHSVITPNSCEYVWDRRGRRTENIQGKPPYFLHIGGVTKSKNTARVIESFIEVNKHSEIKLVVLGDTSENFRRAFPRIAESPNVQTPGRVEDQELFDLMSNCIAVVFPSIEEGFGLPIVEAAFCGVPILTSNISPMSDLAPEASLTVNPLDTAALSAALQRLLTDPVLRERLVNGTERARTRFTRENLSKTLHPFLFED
jgi:glycosyltransferase involved in cell wall biosynthesis